MHDDHDNPETPRESDIRDSFDQEETQRRHEDERRRDDQRRLDDDLRPEEFSPHSLGY